MLLRSALYIAPDYLQSVQCATSQVRENLLDILYTRVRLQLALGALPVDRSPDELVHDLDDSVNGANELVGRVALTALSAIRSYSPMSYSPF
jgi:hypothetical protein